MKTDRIILGIIALGIVAILIALGVKMYRDSQVEQISSYEECVDAGYPILESYPEQCMTPDGRGFTRELTDEELRNLETSF